MTENGYNSVQNLNRIGYELRRLCRLVKSSEPNDLYKKEHNVMESLGCIEEEVREAIKYVQENGDFTTEKLFVDCLKLIEYKLKDILGTICEC